MTEAKLTVEQRNTLLSMMANRLAEATGEVHFLRRGKPIDGEVTGSSFYGKWIASEDGKSAEFVPGEFTGRFIATINAGLYGSGVNYTVTAEDFLAALDAAVADNTLALVDGGARGFVTSTRAKELAAEAEQRRKDAKPTLARKAAKRHLVEVGAMRKASKVADAPDFAALRKVFGKGQK